MIRLGAHVWATGDVKASPVAGLCIEQRCDLAVEVEVYEFGVGHWAEGEVDRRRATIA